MNDTSRSWHPLGTQPNTPPGRRSNNASTPGRDFCGPYVALTPRQLPCTLARFAKAAVMGGEMLGASQGLHDPRPCGRGIVDIVHRADFNAILAHYGVDAVWVGRASASSRA